MKKIYSGNKDLMKIETKKQGFCKKNYVGNLPKM